MVRSLVLAVIATGALVTVLPRDARAAEPAAAAQPTPEQVMADVRTAMQADRADIIAKALTLTADQASKFWPLYKEFEAEQAAIIDAQFKATQKYADSYAKLTDADSAAYVNALLERDQKMHDLRVKWLAKFQTVVPAGTAARVIHVDRRLGLVTQLELAAQIPLVH